MHFEQDHSKKLWICFFFMLDRKKTKLERTGIHIQEQGNLLPQFTINEARPLDFQRKK